MSEQKGRDQMITCEDCWFWDPAEKICKDPEEWVREDTREPCCGYHPDAVPKEETK